MTCEYNFFNNDESDFNSIPLPISSDSTQWFNNGIAWIQRITISGSVIHTALGSQSPHFFHDVTFLTSLVENMFQNLAEVSSGGFSPPESDVTQSGWAARIGNNETPRYLASYESISFAISQAKGFMMMLWWWWCGNRNNQQRDRAMNLSLSVSLHIYDPSIQLSL